MLVSLELVACQEVGDTRGALEGDTGARLGGAVGDMLSHHRLLILLF